MNFDLSDDQQLFRSTVEKFVGTFDTAARHRLRESAHGYDLERWRSLAGLGLIGSCVPEDCGGMGSSLGDLAVVGETLGRTISADPWLENGFLPARSLANAGDKELLPSVIDGSKVVAAALAERAMRYSLTPSATKAIADGNGFRLSGEKTFVLGGAIADAFIVSAACAGETAYFLVPADASGLDIQPYRLVDGSVAVELRFHATAVPADARLAIAADRFGQTITLVRVLASAEMVGLAQRLFDDTVAYTKEREQFGVPIGSFQALQHRMVECYASLEQARSMLWRVVLADDQDTNVWAAQVSGAKAFISEVALKIGREAVQMHGGMGITDELAIGHAFKRLLLLEKLFGGRAEELSHYARAA
ncbi:acyl-CoA dehydrogenase family protein [Tsuneonella mangrovi]|uniref:acyl-CoA dehydrogenase family protein n=1 Tax=Tsuneonella mangrovi TaxID=1982042 RepID=UPI000BA2508C|nr:acyl-CoA dehydrogenase family protein [Tsuneonella mangrovi]